MRLKAERTDAAKEETRREVGRGSEQEVRRTPPPPRKRRQCPRIG